MFFLCFSDPSFSFSTTFTVNKYTLNLTWRDLGRPPWLALLVAPPLARSLALPSPSRVAGNCPSPHRSWHFNLLRQRDLGTVCAKRAIYSCSLSLIRPWRCSCYHRSLTLNARSPLSNSHTPMCFCGNSQVPQHVSARRVLQRRAHLPLQGQDRHEPGRAIRVPAPLQVSKSSLILLLLLLADSVQPTTHFYDANCSCACKWC